jgi:hypothetical protein
MQPGSCRACLLKSGGFLCSVDGPEPWRAYKRLSARHLSRSSWRTGGRAGTRAWNRNSGRLAGGFVVVLFIFHHRYQTLNCASRVIALSSRSCGFGRLFSKNQRSLLLCDARLTFDLFLLPLFRPQARKPRPVESTTVPSSRRTVLHERKRGLYMGNHHERSYIHKDNILRMSTKHQSGSWTTLTEWNPRSRGKGPREIPHARAKRFEM